MNKKYGKRQILLMFAVRNSSKSFIMITIEAYLSRQFSLTWAIIGNQSKFVNLVNFQFGFLLFY
jgi:hypothetical protein